MPSLGTFESTCRTLQSLCREHPNAPPRVLDVGCGEGDMLAFVAPEIREGRGVDVSEEAIARAARRHRERWGHLEFHAARASDLPDLDLGRFDLIFFVSCLEHMRDPEAALSAARAHTRAGSRVVIVALAPNAPHAVLSRWLLRFSDHPVIHHFRREDLARLAARSGFSLEGELPLYRGSRATPAARGSGALLRAYDRIGGPTRAYILSPAEDHRPWANAP